MTTKNKGKTEAQIQAAETARDYAKQNINQIKDAQAQFMDTITQAQEVFLKSTGIDTNQEAAEISKKALNYAKLNLSSGFELASKLVDATDISDALELQNQYVKKQLENYTNQAKELSSLASKTDKK